MEKKRLKEDPRPSYGIVESTAKKLVEPLVVEDDCTIERIKKKLTKDEYMALVSKVVTSESITMEERSQSLYGGNNLILQLNEFDSLVCRLSYISDQNGIQVTFNGEQNFDKLRLETWTEIKKLSKNTDKSRTIENEYIQAIPLSKVIKLYKMFKGCSVREYTIIPKGIRSISTVRSNESVISLTMDFESIKNDENKDYCVFGSLRDFSYVMKAVVPVDYDFPNLEKIKEFVLNDYSSKILALFKDNPYSMPTTTPHLEMYDMINNRWNGRIAGENTLYMKRVLTLTDQNDNICRFVANYIGDYMEKSYIGAGIVPPTVSTIRKWMGGFEIPFLYVYLTKFGWNQETYVVYKLVR